MVIKTENEIRDALQLTIEMFNDKEHRFPYMSYQCILTLQWVLGENENGIPVERIKEYRDFKNRKNKNKK